MNTITIWDILLLIGGILLCIFIVGFAAAVTIGQDSDSPYN